MQERALKAGVDIIVATPGRLMDHMRQQNADLSGVELLVLDEADRMMDMGFWPDVRRIIARAAGASARRCSSRRRCPTRSCGYALEIVREPKYVQVGQRSAPAKTHHPPRRSRAGVGDKLDWLIEHLRQPEGPVLIFSRTKIGADRLARKLAAAGVKCTALHADRTPGSAAHRGRRVSAAASTRCSSPPTSPRAASTSTASTRSSTTRCPTRPMPTCTASAAPAARMRSGQAITLVVAGRTARAGAAGKVRRRSSRMNRRCLIRSPRRIRRAGARRLSRRSKRRPLSAAVMQVQVVPLAPSARRRSGVLRPSRRAADRRHEASIRKPGAPTARSTSSAARPRSAARTTIVLRLRLDSAT